MELTKYNNVVSIYNKPVYGSIKSNKPVMALSIDKKSSNPYRGIIRTITKRKGDVQIHGFVDQSKLIIVEGDGLKFQRIKDLKLKGIEKIVDSLSDETKFFIGLEDPDIWYDENKKMHLYFTIAFKKYKKGHKVYLGHAQGKDLNSLEATMPVLGPIENKAFGFKEVAISPIKTKEGRINLTESGTYHKGTFYSTIAIVKAREMNERWDFINNAAKPWEMPYKWCRGSLSPCSILPIDFASHNGLLVFFVNGREKDIIKNKVMGKFCVGIGLFNPHTNEIPWISPEPLIDDPDARTITFASDFIQTGKDKGILYCHVDDSFVRAYQINAKELRKYLKEKVRL